MKSASKSSRREQTSGACGSRASDVPTYYVKAIGIAYAPKAFAADLPRISRNSRNGTRSASVSTRTIWQTTTTARNQRRLRAIMLDLDKFKVFNDTYGQPTQGRLS